MTKTKKQIDIMPDYMKDAEREGCELPQDLEDGVRITGFSMEDPNSITLNEKRNQPRTQTYDPTNLKRVKNQLEEKGVKGMDPMYCTRDPITGVLVVESGHHRKKAASELGFPKIPVIIIEYYDRADGLDPREEFLQDQNNHEACQSHNEQDGLQYLNKYKQLGHFDECFKIEDDKKKISSIRKKAHELLKRHYDRYSKQKRGGIVTKFLGGATTSKLKTWTNKEAESWFTNNNHLDNLGSYDYPNNRFDAVTQSTTINLQSGIMLGKLLEVTNAWKNDGLNDKQIKQKLNNLTIRLGIYVPSTKISTYDDLQKKRKECLSDAKKINLDNLHTPNLTISEIIFVYQSLVDPEEKPEPHFYKWDAKNKEWSHIL
jgi:hypothetical protein